MMSNTVKLFLLTLASIVITVLLIIRGIGLEDQKSKEILPSPIVVASDVLGENKQNDATESAEVFKVVKVVDGDTIEVEKNEDRYKVRYIGVDTPETVDPRRGVQCFGKEASNENKRLVEGKEVKMEKDVSETDRFGRLLRFVYLKVDNDYLFVNDYLIRSGFARALTYPPDVKYSERFLAAEREARENKLGLWSKCAN